MLLLNAILSRGFKCEKVAFGTFSLKFSCTLLWKKIVVILRLTQLQMKLLLCPYVRGHGERLKAVVFLKTDRSGSCTWLRELPVRSKKTPSQWSVPCEMRQDLKTLSIFCWMDLLWATRVEIFWCAVSGNWRWNEWTHSCFEGWGNKMQEYFIGPRNWGVFFLS